MERESGRDLVRRAVKASMAARNWNVSDLTRAADIDPGTAGDFLKGTRWPKLKTQSLIEKALGWPPGTFSGIVGGDEPPPVGEDTEDGDDDPDIIRYRRPEGMTDEAWARLRASLTDYIEYQLDRAARER